MAAKSFPHLTSSDSDLELCFHAQRRVLSHAPRVSGVVPCPGDVAPAMPIVRRSATRQQERLLDLVPIGAHEQAARYETDDSEAPVAPRSWLDDPPFTAIALAALVLVAASVIVALAT